MLDLFLSLSLCLRFLPHRYEWTLKQHEYVYLSNAK